LDIDIKPIKLDDLGTELKLTGVDICNLEGFIEE